MLKIIHRQQLYILFSVLPVPDRTLFDTVGCTVAIGVDIVESPVDVAVTVLEKPVGAVVDAVGVYAVVLVMGDVTVLDDIASISVALVADVVVLVEEGIVVIVVGGVVFAIVCVVELV